MAAGRTGWPQSRRFRRSFWLHLGRRWISLWRPIHAIYLRIHPSTDLINPNNLAILLRHLRCATFELPFAADEQLRIL